MKEIIRRIKRNPVLNIFLFVIAGQFAHDYLAGRVEWDNFTVYMATLIMGVVARMYVVPVEDHEDLKEKLSLATTWGFKDGQRTTSENVEGDRP